LVVPVAFSVTAKTEEQAPLAGITGKDIAALHTSLFIGWVILNRVEDEHGDVLVEV